MLKNLVKIRLSALLYSMFGKRYSMSSVSKPKKILIALVTVYIVSMLLFSMGTMMYPLAAPLSEAGLGWLYFSVAALFASVFSIMGSVFTVHKEIFDAADNELLLSLPIPYAYILASRLIIIVVLEFMYAGVVMIPAVVVYAVKGVGLSAQGIISLIIATALLLLLVLTIGTILSWIISLVISRLRAKAFVTTILMFGFIGLYLWFYNFLSRYANKLITQGHSLADTVKKALPPIYSFGMAVAESGATGLLHLGLFALWSLIPFAVAYILLSRSFLRLATAGKVTAGKAYKRRELKVSSSFGALVRKELNRFFTLPIYILNCALGSVFMLIIAGYAVIRLDRIMEIVAYFPEGNSLIAPIFCLALGYCALLNNTAAPSLSLEGKALWILKAHPIRPEDVYRAKIACNLIITLPFVVISGIVLAVVLPVGALEKALILIVPTIITFFTATFGMAANILFPRFEWINETMVVKQSASVLIAVLGGIAIAAALVFIFIPVQKFISPVLYLVLCALAFFAASLALYRWIMTKGVERFKNMG